MEPRHSHVVVTWSEPSATHLSEYHLPALWGHPPPSSQDEHSLQFASLERTARSASLPPPEGSCSSQRTTGDDDGIPSTTRCESAQYDPTPSYGAMALTCVPAGGKCLMVAEFAVACPYRAAWKGCSCKSACSEVCQIERPQNKSRCRSAAPAPTLNTVRTTALPWQASDGMDPAYCQ
mgnify:CR=1 FL=1